MFTFTRLGKAGRFGNQLFQVAATLGMGARHHVDCIFPTWEHSDCFRTPIPQTSEPLTPEFTLRQHIFHYKDIALSFGEPCLIDLYGGFQSEKYFAPYAHIIKEYFHPAFYFSSEIAAQYGESLRSNVTCIVVVRRGDYAFLQDHHPMQPAEFYASAISMFPKDTLFFITSDDIQWCRAKISAPRIVYLPQEKCKHNFFLGTQCDHVITSNTTFGWWLAWLSRVPNPRVIAPRRWFGPGYAHYNTKDLLPDRWTVI